MNADNSAIRVGYYPTHSSTRVRFRTLQEVIDCISTGSNGLDGKQIKMQNAIGGLNQQGYDDVKATLPSFTVSGAPKKRRTDENLFAEEGLHTGVFILDIDPEKKIRKDAEGNTVYHKNSTRPQTLPITEDPDLPLHLATAPHIRNKICLLYTSPSPRD